MNPLLPPALFFKHLRYILLTERDPLSKRRGKKSAFTLIEVLCRALKGGAENVCSGIGK